MAESEFVVILGYTMSLRNTIRPESTFLLHADPSVGRRMMTRQSGGKETLSCFSGPALPAPESHSPVTVPLRDAPYFFLVQKHWYLTSCLSQILVCQSQEAHLPRSLVMSPASFLAMQVSSDWLDCLPHLVFQSFCPFLHTGAHGQLCQWVLSIQQRMQRACPPWGSNRTL